MSEGIKSAAVGFNAWLREKPYWYRFVWKLNMEKDKLTEEDMDLCYSYLTEALFPDKTDSLSKAMVSLSFPDQDTVPMEDVTRVKLREIKDFEGVNALSPSCSLKVSDNLTLIYGLNGSGKSGIARLLCNACFSRGVRKVLSNARRPSDASMTPSATFVLKADAEEPVDLKFRLGDQHPILKRFAVFDGKSVALHLDQANPVSFTPAHIEVFDKVAASIDKLEARLLAENLSCRKSNPFNLLFAEGEVSEVVSFCNGISAETTQWQLEKNLAFDSVEDDQKITELVSEIEMKKKCDPTKERERLQSEIGDLQQLKGTLAEFAEALLNTNGIQINHLVEEIKERAKVVEELGAATFEKGGFSTTGSGEWRALIQAARVLLDSEIATNPTFSLEHCMLCHQALSLNTRSLFGRYWEFLESKAENDLQDVTLRVASKIEDLSGLKRRVPKLPDTEIASKLLETDAPGFLAELRRHFGRIEETLDAWLSCLRQLKLIEGDLEIREVALSDLDELVLRKTEQASALSNIDTGINILLDHLTILQHKKVAARLLPDAGLYIEYLRWQRGLSNVNFPGLKRAATTKRKEQFLESVAKNYGDIFNDEMKNLGCELNLVMLTAGEQGNTTKEYRLDFATQYSPGQILSEGEQNATAIADFLTENQLDSQNCGIIFDDPVTSLDHERKDRIAERLVRESKSRQVVIFTHDLVFMGKLAWHANREKAATDVHWIRTVNGIPGCVEDNSSPKLANLRFLRNKAQEVLVGIESLGVEEQYDVMYLSLDYLRSACEALIEETLFAGTIARYEDQIRVQNLQDAVLDAEIAQRIVDLHGELSCQILAHNRSDLQRENLLSLVQVRSIHAKFDALRSSAEDFKKDKKKERENARKSMNLGW